MEQQVALPSKDRGPSLAGGSGVTSQHSGSWMLDLVNSQKAKAAVSAGNEAQQPPHTDGNNSKPVSRPTWDSAPQLDGDSSQQLARNTAIPAASAGPVPKKK